MPIVICYEGDPEAALMISANRSAGYEIHVGKDRRGRKTFYVMVLNDGNVYRKE
jgi:hypothetical protein